MRGKSKSNDFFEPSPKIITKLYPVTHKVNKNHREEERLQNHKITSAHQLRRIKDENSLQNKTC